MRLGLRGWVCRIWAFSTDARLPCWPVWPLNRTAGRGRSGIASGVVAVRMILYMATLTATRHNLAICALYTRLCRRGKPQKVALVILNAVLRDQVPWQPPRLARLDSQHSCCPVSGIGRSRFGLSTVSANRILC